MAYQQPGGMTGSGRPAENVPEAREVVLLLLDHFTHLAFAGTLEALRLANQVAGRPIYRSRIATIDGRPVFCSNGFEVMPDGMPGRIGRRCRLVIVGGLGRHRPDMRLTTLVQGAEVHGAEIIGLCGGVQVLAGSGLLRDRECSVHWYLRDAMREQYPDMKMTSRAYVAGRISTAAGGIAAADLMLHLISGDHGGGLARRVADLMIHGSPRGAEGLQTISMPGRLGIRNPHLSRALRVMEENLEMPLAIPELASRVGISVRQMERLFSRYLQQSPGRQYLSMRLARAKRLVLQSDLTVDEIALAAGFESRSHFRKCFRQHFGSSVHQTRALDAGGHGAFD